MVRPGFDERLLVRDLIGTVVAPFGVDLSLDAAFIAWALPAR